MCIRDRSRRERSLDVRLHLEAELDRLFRYQARSEQYPRVGSIGARGDRGDQDVAVTQLGAVESLVGPLEVLRLLAEAVVLHRRGEERREGRLDLGEVDAVLRALGARERGHDGSE